jgi:hypothetical protein
MSDERFTSEDMMVKSLVLDKLGHPEAAAILRQAAQTEREREVGGAVTDEEVRDAASAYDAALSFQSDPAKLKFDKMRAALESFAARRAAVPDGCVQDIYELAKTVGAELDGGEYPDQGFPGCPPTITFTDRQFERFVLALKAPQFKQVGEAEFDPDGSGKAEKAILYRTANIAPGTELYAMRAAAPEVKG